MVTYRRCLSELLVRFQPLHLFLLLFFALFLSPMVNASEVGYVERPDTFFDEFVSDESLFSLNTTMPTHTFYLPSLYDSVSWRWNQNESMVTRASDFSQVMWDRLDDGDKTLMGAVANVLGGLDKKIEANAVSVPVLNNWINTKDAFVSTGGASVGYSVPNLLAVISKNQQWLRKEIMTGVASNSAYRTDGLVHGPITFGNLLQFLTYNTNDIFKKIDERTKATDSDLIFQTVSFSGWDIIRPTKPTLMSALAGLSQNQVGLQFKLRDFLTVPENSDILYKDGTVHLSNGYDLAQITAWGFLGLSQNIAGTTKEIQYTVTDPSDPFHTVDYHPDSLFDFLSAWGSDMQAELTKLRFVLASDDDIHMKEEEKPNEDAVKDHFFGDGEGAVKPGDISSAGDLAGGVKDSFSGAGSPTDAFVAINSSDAYSFFSQEVSNSLDTVGAPSVVLNDDFMDDFVANDEGFYTLFDTSYFDVKSFLQGENK